MAQERIFGGKPVLQFSTNHDRRNFLKWAGLVGVGATFAAGGLLATPSSAEAAEIIKASKAGGDVDILNYALTLEYLEADFYAQGLQAGLLTERELELVTPIGDHENQHVTQLTAAVTGMGGTPAAKPKITYPAGVFDSRDSFLTNASMFEELGVTAYHGQVPLISSTEVLGAAASIAGVESRHAAVVAYLLGTEPFPSPTEGAKSMDEVVAAITPLIS